MYAASHEGALHLDDVLARRTRISIEAWDRGVSAAPVAARLMARRARLGRRLARPSRSSATCSGSPPSAQSQEQPDDESADRVRLEAPDIVKVD